MAFLLLCSLSLMLCQSPPPQNSKGSTTQGESSTYLYFVVRWCKKTKISSLANSFPGHEWVPLPNGIYVLGFGATCHTTWLIDEYPLHPIPIPMNNVIMMMLWWFSFRRDFHARKNHFLLFLTNNAMIREITFSRILVLLAEKYKTILFSL